MVQTGPKGVRAKFADAMTELARETAIEDPDMYAPREGFLAGMWPGAPFDKLPPGCPVVPLGVDGKQSFFIDSMGQLLSFEGLKEDGLIKLFRATPNYVYWAWPRKTKAKNKSEGEEWIINGVEVKKAIACLEKACAQRGLFDPLYRLRGRGAWADRVGRLVWHSGDHLWTVRGSRLEVSDPGEIDGIFYPRRASILEPWREPVPPDDSPAGAIFEMLKSWTWERPVIDPLIVLGGIGVMMLCGALHQRPHLAAMGDFGVGKTGLQDFVKALLGSALIRAENATEAGVRQNMGLDALPVALDEFEAREDNRRAMALLELARQAYSGGTVLRGGADHKGVLFIARNAFFCSGINMPPMLPQDLSRFAVLNLGKLEIGEGDKRKAAPVVKDEWGRMLLRALMDAWPQFNVVHADMRGVLNAAGLTGRAGDTYGTIFAFARILLGDEGFEAAGMPITEARALGTMIAALTAEERADQVDNWRLALEHLVSAPLDLMHNGRRQSLGIAIERMQDRDAVLQDEDLAREAARIAGCKLMIEADGDLPHGVKRILIAVPPRGTFLERIYQDTRWTEGGWFAALRQGPSGIVIRDRGNKQIHKINGATQRCLLVDLTAYDQATRPPPAAQ